MHDVYIIKKLKKDLEVNKIKMGQTRLHQLHKYINLLLVLYKQLFYA